MHFNEIIRTLYDFVFPRYCVVCRGRLLPFERHLCLRCLCDIPYTYCWNDIRRPWVFALFHYSDISPYKRLALSVKYMGNAVLGRELGMCLGRYAAVSGLAVDVVAPVPLHWMREYSRGYNQAGEIAKGFVAGYASVKGSTPEMLPHLIRRARYTRSQTSVNVSGKSGNVRGAFRPGRDLQRLEEMLSCRGRLSLLIIDDTCTTGATLFACADALKCCGPELEIYFAALAKVRED